MRNYSYYYKYIIVYANNLLITSKYPEIIIKSLEDTYKFKLKGTRDII